MEELFFCCVGSGRKPSPENPPSQVPTPSDGSMHSHSMNGFSSTSNSSSQKAAPPTLRPMQELVLHYEVNWTATGELGRGHFAKVYRGKHRLTNRKVAAKRILRSGSKTSTLHNEIKALAKLNHPNIVRLFDVFYDDVYVVLVLEFLGGGELFGRIVKGGAYSERDASKHFRELAQAITYMHRHGIVHRDLKPENLVLAEPRLDSQIKISDFGLSKILDSGDMITVCGTRAYSAPEINFGNDPSRKGKKYTAKVDVWSMGVILFVILGAYHPFDPFGNLKDDEIWERITFGAWDFNDKVWDSISPQAKDLLKKMICIDPEARLSIDQVLQHEWLQVASVDNLPSVNLKTVKNASFRAAMGMDIDSQVNFSTQIVSPSKNDEDDMDEVVHGITLH